MSTHRSRLHVGLAALSLLGIIFCTSPTPIFAKGEKPTLDEDAKQLVVDALGSQASPEDAAHSLDRKFALKAYSHAALRDHLASTIHASETKKDEAQNRRAENILLHLFLRAGKIKDALDLAEPQWAKGKSNDRLRLGELQEAAGRNAKALDTYLSLAKESGETGWIASLRAALLRLDGVSGTSPAPARGIEEEENPSSDAEKDGSSKDKESKDKDEDPNSPTAILTAAVKRSPEALREARGNRAAMILALTGKADEARALYSVPQDAEKPIRYILRLAQWCLHDRAWKEARTWAEKAIDTATLRRDRRYAYALLTEAYRGTHDLPGLIERLLGQDDLTDEAQDVLIELLRETGQPEKALAFFDEEKRQSLTPEIQRQFLEMLRDAGRADDMVAGYKDAIVREPDRLLWRSGLSRYYLEEGKPEEARSVWNDVLEVRSRFAPERGPWIQLGAAEEVASQGLHELAFQLGERAAKEEVTQFPALLFLADLHVRTGDTDGAETVLERFDAAADPGAKERFQLAEVYERLGRKDKAATILEDLRRARGEGTSEEDLDMRLAVLLSEVDRDADALKLWLDVWQRVNAPARRQYVEDRILTVAAREGKLADIAVNLEERLVAGKASEREGGLLIRLYTRVGDPVSAAEVLEERVKRQKTDQIKALQEQARIYLTCTDYYNYEEVVRKLVKLDPEGERDYLRQLAMSALERGRPLEARGSLRRLKKLEGGVDGAEFEAGILALGGLNDDAMAAYRKGIAAHPERIEVYLLLAKTMAAAKQKDDAIGMFQSLLTRAVKDDLFTVAVDGLLNMEAPNPVLQWARRRIVERVSHRVHRVFFYQLYGDLSEQLKENQRMVVALSESLPVAGERRGSILREIMEISSQSGFSPFYYGPRQDEGGGTKLRYGRRLLLLGDVVPPQVYLDLGRSFLENDEVSVASRTFSLARDLPDFDAFRKQVAETFETAGYLPEALRLYQRALIGRAESISLLKKIGTLHELEGRYALAFARYRRAMDLILLQRPFADRDAAESFGDNPWMRYWGGKNLDAYDEHYDEILRAYLATMPQGDELRAILRSHLALIDKDYADVASALAKRAKKRKDDAHVNEEDAKIRAASFPRLHSRIKFVRRLALASDDRALADKMDLRLIAQFPKDVALVRSLVRERLGWGLVSSALAMTKAADLEDQETSELLLMAGERPEEPSVAALKPSEAVRVLLAPLVRGDDDTVRSLLRRVDASLAKKADIKHITLLAKAAVHMGENEVLLSLGRRWLHLAATAGSGWSRGTEVRSAIDFCWPHFDDVSRKSLVHPLGRVVVKEPKEAQYVLPVIEDVQAALDTSLLTEEEAKKVIDELVGGKRRTSMYSAAKFFALLPKDAHTEFLRKIFEKEPVERRAQSVIWALGQLAGKLSDDALDYLEATMRGSLKKMKEPMRWWSYGQTLTSNEKHAAVNFRFLKVITGEDPDEPPHLAALALAHRTMGEKEKAWSLAEKAFSTFMERGADDWTMRAPLSRVIDVFGEDHADAFLDVIDTLEKKNGPNETTTTWKLNLLSRDKKPEEVLALLERARDKDPKNKSILNRLQTRLQSMGRPMDAIALMQRRLDDAPDDQSLKNQLAGAWQRLKHPIHAENAKRGKDASKAPSKEDQERAKKKFKPATVKRIKEAIEAKNVDEARTLMHQMWRGISPGASSNRFGHVIYIVNGVAQMHGGGSLAGALWPTDEATKRRVIRGGFPDFESMREDERKRREDKKDDRRLSAYEVLVDHEFGRREIERELRTKSGTGLEGATNLLRALNRARAQEIGHDKLVAELVERVRGGQARSDTLYRLLLLAEDHADSLGEGGEKIAKGLMTNVEPGDSPLILRLSNCLAAAGNTHGVARLLLWCARLSSSGGGFDPFGIYQPQTSTHSVIQAIRKHLQGEQRNSAIEAVLAMSDPRKPKLERSTDQNPWERFGTDESYSSLLLNTWSEVIGAKATLQRFDDIVKRVLDTERSIQRNAAATVVRLAAEAGDYELALRALEVAVCAFPDWSFPADAKLEPNMRYFIEYRERLAHNARGISPGLLFTLFVRDLGAETATEGGEGNEEDLGEEASKAVDTEGDAKDEPAPDESARDEEFYDGSVDANNARILWLLHASETLERWVSEERMKATYVFGATCVIASELHRLGAVEEASALLSRAREQAKGNVRSMLWIADALRAMEREDEALAIERALLSGRTIHLERVPFVVRKVLEKDGHEAALRLGEDTATFTLHPDFLRVMIEAASKAGDNEAEAKWRATAKEAWPKETFK